MRAQSNSTNADHTIIKLVWVYIW